MIDTIRQRALDGQLLYSKHARDEMEREEFGVITDEEAVSVLTGGKIIEPYPDDKPYPSFLVFGLTEKQRPLHVVCAMSTDEDLLIIVTVYQPHPARWIDFERRKR